MGDCSFLGRPPGSSSFQAAAPGRRRVGRDCLVALDADAGGTTWSIGRELGEADIETKGLTPDVRNSAGQALCHVRYAYPLWTAVVLLPLGVLPLAIASSLWLSACIAIAIAGMRWSVLAARVPARWVPAYALVVVFSQPFWLLLILGQMNGALMAIVGLATLSLARGREARAGIALALAALKPNVLPVFGAVVVARAIAERRARLLVAAAGTLAALFAISLAAKPDWVPEWLHELFGRQIGHAFEYGTAWGLASAVLGDTRWAPVLIAGLVVAIAVAVRGQRNDALTLCALAVPVSLFATPYAWSYDYLTLALSWAFVLSAASRAPERTRIVLLVLLLGLAILLPWVVWIVSRALSDVAGALLQVTAAVVAGVTVYLLGARAMRVRELDVLARVGPWSRPAQ